MPDAKLVPDSLHTDGMKRTNKQNKQNKQAKNKKTKKDEAIMMS